MTVLRTVGPVFKMNYSTLQLAFEAGIATLTLNRPDRRNAISYELIDDLLRALEEVKNSGHGSRVFGQFLALGEAEDHRLDLFIVEQCATQDALFTDRLIF